MSGMDGARAAARRNAWMKIRFECPCGKVVRGNGKAHQRACPVHLRERGWPLDAAWRATFVSEYGPERGGRIHRAVQKALGVYELDRRAGRSTEVALAALRWVDFKNLIWREADAAAKVAS